MSNQPADTSSESHAVQLAIYRRLGPTARAEIAGRLSADTRELTRAGVRARHPDYPAGDVELACRRVWLGDELFRRAWPNSPLIAP
jgi:hypothetical protein